MSKILTNCISLTCKQLLEEKLNGDELLKIRQICQYFPRQNFALYSMYVHQHRHYHQF